MEDIIWAKAYTQYGVALLNHKVKHGDIDAIEKMAHEMYPYVPPNSVLVPVPGHTGIAIATKILSEHIRKLTGSRVKDYVIGKEREMLYMMKKRGASLTDDDFGFWLRNSLDGYNVILIDHVCATGTTFRALKNIIPNARLLVHSIDLRIMKHL